MILHSVKNDIVDHSVYLKADGSVDLTGNLSVDAGITIDGVDISEHDHSGAGKGGTVVWASIDKTTSDIADITTKSHTSLSDIGNNTHAQIDSHLADNTQAHSDYLRNDIDDTISGSLEVIKDSQTAFFVRDAVGLSIFTVNTITPQIDFRGTLYPTVTNEADLGTSTVLMRHGYFAGNLSDGTDSLTIANAKTAYDHSQDNTQAHSDYLRNDALDTGKSLVLTDATNIPLVLNNSTGTQNILTGQQNGTDRFYVDDDGVLFLRPNDSTTQVAPLSVIYNVQHDGSHQGIGNVIKQDVSITGTARTIQGGNYVAQGKNTGQSSLTLVGSWSTVSQQVVATLPTASSTKAGINVKGGVAGTITNANLFETILLARDGTITNARGLYIPVFTKDTGNIVNSYGIHLEEQTIADTINREIFLEGAGEIFFRDGDVRIGSQTDGHLDLQADISIDLNTAADTDIVLNFIGTTNSGSLIYMEDEDRFDFDKDVKVGNDIEVVGELKGGRVIIDGGNNADNTADGYMKFNNGTSFQATLGYRMTRPGSVVGVGFQTNVTAVTTGGTVDMEIRKNGAAVFSTTLTISGTGLQGADSTQARNTDTFVAGDILTFYINFGTFVGTITDTCGIGELQFDT